MSKTILQRLALATKRLKKKSYSYCKTDPTKETRADEINTTKFCAAKITKA
jgi:hypothetical protein